MNRILEVSCLLLCCSLAGCSRSDNADIAKARAKPEAAKKGGPKKPGLDGAGSVTFPDGKKKYGTETQFVFDVPGVKVML